MKTRSAHLSPSTAEGTPCKLPGMASAQVSKDRTAAERAALEKGPQAAPRAPGASCPRLYDEHSRQARSRARSSSARTRWSARAVRSSRATTRSSSAPKRERVVGSRRPLPIARAALRRRPVIPADPIIGLPRASEAHRGPLRARSGCTAARGTTRWSTSRAAASSPPALAGGAPATLRTLIANAAARGPAAAPPVRSGERRRAARARSARDPPRRPAPAVHGAGEPGEDNSRTSWSRSSSSASAPSPATSCARPAAPIRPMLPRVIGIAANFHDAEAPQILGPETIVLDGTAHAEDRIGIDLPHRRVRLVRAGAPRAGRARARHPAPRDRVARERRARRSRGRRGPAAGLVAARAEPPRILDLYGGSGAISLALAQARQPVTDGRVLRARGSERARRRRGAGAHRASARCAPATSPRWRQLARQQPARLRRAS